MAVAVGVDVLAGFADFGQGQAGVVAFGAGVGRGAGLGCGLGDGAEQEEQGAACEGLAAPAAGWVGVQEFGPRSMEMGCQRRRSSFGRTVGLTQDMGQRPVSGRGGRGRSGRRRRRCGRRG